MAKRHYELHVAGCTRQLPILNISDKLAIAGFVILGDTEIVENCAKELASRVPKDTDIIMTAETKGIPLAHELASVLGMVLAIPLSAFIAVFWQLLVREYLAPAAGREAEDETGGGGGE